MPPKVNFPEYLVKALQDDAIANAIGKILEVRVNEIMSKVSSLKAEVLYLKNANAALTTRLNSLEAYNRRENSINTGLFVGSFAETAATSY